MKNACAAAVTLALVTPVAACSSSSSGGAASVSTRGCPNAPTTHASVPAGAAARVPHPATVETAKRLPVSVKGESEVQFTTAIPLSFAAAFVQREYPAHGYRITGGDAEAHEADIIWAHGDATGKTKLSGDGACSTTWTVLALPAGASAPD